MKNFFKPLFLAVLIAGTTLTSCSEDNTNEIFNPDNPDVNPVGPDTEKIKTLTVDASSKNPTATVHAKPGESVDVIVEFIKDADAKDFKRMYVTKNDFGSDEGTVAYDIKAATGAGDLKRDGSIDLGSDKKETVRFKLPFQGPKQADGKVQYQVWVTGGGLFTAGDIRDIHKRNAFGKETPSFITITVVDGKGTAVNNGVMKQYTKTLLAAPLKDGSSKSFISIFNGEKYKINEGEETAALWDFGYYYGAKGKASFASASDYPKSIIDIKKYAKLNDQQVALLNKCYFELAKGADFDGADASALNALSVSKSKQTISGLKEGDVIKFVDQYGAKGLIKVTKVKGTLKSGDSITFDMKVLSVGTLIKG